MSDLDDSDVDTRESFQDSFHNPPPPDDGQPYMEIMEQPQSRGFRFRYACEGKSHGGLQGINSRREKKSYPTVRINRYKGPAKICITLVTDEKAPKPHAHELIGKNCQNGTCSVSIKGENMTVSFPNLGVRHVTKKSVHQILTERLRESLKVDKMMKGELGQDADHIQLTEEEDLDIRKRAEVQAKTMPLSVVRLSFQAYLQDSKGIFSRVLLPVISNPIFDSKAPCAALLKICRMDKVGGCCTGNEEVFLLCDKVQKDDIAVRFYEQDEDSNVKWEDYGNFAPHDVHRQYAIVFRTPAYMNTMIEHPITVHVQLKRFSDGEVSDPKIFTYYPQQTDLEDIQKKRKKQIPNFGDGDSFSSPSTGSLNIGSIHQNSLGTNNAFGDYNQYNSNTNGHSRARTPVCTNNIGSWMIQHTAAIVPQFVQLETDSFPFYDSSPRLVPRGAPASSPAWGKEEEPKTESTVTPPTSRIMKEVKDRMETSGDNKSGSGLEGLLSSLTDRMAGALQQYARTGDSRCMVLPVRHLICCYDSNLDNSLHLSIIHNQSDVAKSLLSVLSTLPLKPGLDDCNALRQTALYLALITKQEEVLGAILKSGADYTTVDKRGDMLIHVAARTGNHTCLEMLLRQSNNDATGNQAKKIDVNALNYNGFCALHLAVCAGHLACVRLLVTVGQADVNLADGRSGKTALHHDIDTDNLAIVGHLILECGAEVDMPAYDGNTPLHLAVAGNKLGITALLLAADADPDTENQDQLEADSSDDEDEDMEAGSVIPDKPSIDQSQESMAGTTPKDLATGNPRMLRLLNGEPYASVSEMISPLASSITAVPDFEERLKSVFDSGIDSIHIRSGVNRSLPPSADLYKLDLMTRARLGKLLDPVQTGSDWRELAERLGLQSLVGPFQLQKSPTRALLDNYEVLDGSSTELRKLLVEMKRTDAVGILDQVLQN